MFFDDAIVASKELEIALTQRDCGGDKKSTYVWYPPHHVSDSYISKLVEKGYKVAICEQLEDPSVAKGLVKRDVIRIVTPPGTISDLNVLDEKSNNYLVSIYLDNIGVGISYVDTTTGEMYTTEYIGNEESSYTFVLDELGKISPSEMIANKIFMKNKKITKFIENRLNPFINLYDDKFIAQKDWIELILSHFKINNLNTIGIKKTKYTLLYLLGY